MTTSHKYSTAIQLNQNHPIAIAVNQGNAALNAHMCERGCGSFLLPAEGLAFRADGNPAPRMCPNAVAPEAGADKEETKIHLGPDRTVELLRAIRMPTKAELAQEATSGYLRFGDPLMVDVPKKERDGVTSAMGETQDKVIQALVAWLSALTDAVAALPPGVQMLLPAVQTQRILGVVAAGGAAVAPVPVPFRAALAHTMTLATTAMGLSTLEAYVVADSARWKSAPTPYFSFTAAGTPVPQSFYWSTLLNATKNDRASRLERLLYTLPTDADVALSPIQDVLSMELTGPRASLMGAAPLLGLLRAASLSTAANIPLTQFWTCWRNALTAAAARARKDFKDVQTQYAAANSPNGRKRVRFDGANIDGGGGGAQRSDDGDGTRQQRDHQRPACPHCGRWHGGTCRLLQTQSGGGGGRGNGGRGRDGQGGNGRGGGQANTTWRGGRGGGGGNGGRGQHR